MKKIFTIIIFLISIVGIAQEENLSQKEILLKAYFSKDSSDYYFQQAKNKLYGKSDSIHYQYFKFFKNDELRNKDSTLYYAEKILPFYLKNDSIQNIEYIYERLHYLYKREGVYDKALVYNQKLIDLSEQQNKLGKTSKYLTDKSTLNHDFENFEEGVAIGKDAFLKALKTKENQKENIIYANNAIAINFDDWHKPDSAIFYHQKNLDLIKTQEDSLNYGFVFNNLGNTFLKDKKYQEAKKMISLALKRNLEKGNSYNLATNYTNLATIAYQENKNDLAEEYFEEAKKHSDLSNSIEKIRDVIQQEAWYYKKVGNFQKALELQEKFSVLKDSVFQEERLAKFAELETKYQTEKKEAELATTRANLAEKELDLERKNTIIYGSIAIAFIIGLLGYLLYNQQKLKNKQLHKEAELKSALVKIETQNKLQEQRLKISRDLHDNIGAQLTFIISSIDNLQFAFPNMEQNISRKLKKISEFTSKTIYELRDTIWAMNKEKISVEDLQARISNFIEKARTASPNTVFRFQFDSEQNNQYEFSSVVGMNIYRIIQEAVNNALKYAEASEIKVHIEKLQQQFKIEIIDNGKGFVLAEVELGNGINNIKKRAKEIGGEAEIHTIVREGTQILILLPVLDENS
ncbi:tetratricopeptide repeat-containing sensor histidine kinase [Mesonia mobilis]|uniref:ATP-binding protein n=1 Tax=Mesonia mobilis TaxID=369791 RepID=UPI0024B9CF1F|nr:tetratricopeptide repeat-containing sensor histidine kinase [Mesonia mobilis]